MHNGTTLVGKFSVKLQAWIIIAACVLGLLEGHVTTAWAKDLPPRQNAISAQTALDRLMDGNTRYIQGTSKNRDFSIGRSARATAQYPIATILSCSDSRVAPELIFDQGPGDIFLVRVAGNFVNEDGLASIEYALKLLDAPLIVVLGHSQCGAVNAAIKWVKEQTELPGHLPQLVNTIKPAVKVAQHKLAQKKSKLPIEDALLLQRATIENIQLNVHRLATAQPIIAPLVRAEKVKVVGAIYDIKTGKVRLVN